MSSEQDSPLSEPPDSQRLDSASPEEQDEPRSSVEQASLPAEEPSEAGRLCDPFLDRFAAMMNHDNMSSILDDQAHVLSVFEVANEKLASVNRISEANYFNMSVELRQTTRTLATMKKELDSIFRRIRSLKSQVACQYPEAYTTVLAQQKIEGEGSEED